MESVNHIIDNYVDDYLKESETPFTKEEFYNSIGHILPLTLGEDNRVVGFIGLDIFPSQYLKESVPVWKVIYIDPKERKPHSFKEAVTIVLQSLKTQGFKRVEMHMNQKINNWFRRHLHSKPVQYVHLHELDFYIDQLTKGE